MIQYKCKCGNTLIVKVNTEVSRGTKKAFKETHGNRKGYDRQCKADTLIYNPGHGYTRTIAKKEA